MKINKVDLTHKSQVQNVAQAKAKSARNLDSVQNMELSNVYYKPVSFGRKIEEHRSWGARINPETKEASFKILTFPDAKQVTVVVGSGDYSEEDVRIELEAKGKGIFEKTGISPDLVKETDKYLYEIVKADGNIEIVKDPYTFKQDEVNGPSEVYDHSSFKWQNDDAWQKSKKRITRTSNGKDGHLSVRDARIYALSPDSITDERSYEAVKSKLKEIKQNGFNTVEIMHVENTFSFNWGYDGVDKMAPSSFLGGPDQLKGLVDEAHKEGLNVVFDVIPNHIGPDGNQLGRTGPYIKGPNDFGDAINYEGENSEYVRDYIINAMMNWFENYHVDGLRLDMTKYMQSDHTLKQLCAEINYHYPDGFLIAEDGRGGVSVDGNGNFWENSDEIHDKRVTSKLLPEEYGKGKSQDEHAQAIRKIAKGKGNLARLGLDSEWDFSYYHELDTSLYTQNTSKLIKAALCAQDSVKYTASHDEIGNYEGTRKLAKLMVPKLRLNESVMLNMDDINRAKEYASRKHQNFENALQTITFQKAQFVAEQLAMKYQKGELDKYEVTPEMTHEQGKEIRTKLHNEVLSPLGIRPETKMTYKRIKGAFERSYSQNKMALALTYAIPGPKMVFQGDENADLTPFRFFRRFESVPYEEYLFTEKGYAPAEAALEESTIGKIKYSKDGEKRMENFRALVQDLNELNTTNSAMTRGYIETDSIVDHSMSSVIAFSMKDPSNNNEIFAVTNTGETNYREEKDNEYWIKFPQGRWVEILNTDDEKYGGSSKHINQHGAIHGNGASNHPINLAGYSTVYFKRIG